MALSLPGHENLNLRLPYAVVMKRHVVAPETFDDLLSIFSWSMKWLGLGRHPPCRHDGEPFRPEEQGRAKVAGQALRVRSILVELRGDWACFKDGSARLSTQPLHTLSSEILAWHRLFGRRGEPLARTYLGCRAGEEALPLRCVGDVRLRKRRGEMSIWMLLGVGNAFRTGTCCADGGHVATLRFVSSNSGYGFRTRCTHTHMQPTIPHPHCRERCRERLPAWGCRNLFAPDRGVRSRQGSSIM